jgi:hypothetical protein
MAKPEAVRRIKSYSSASGFVYQYQFHEVNPAQRNNQPGNEYIYYVSADRKTMFPLRIFVSRAAMEQGGKGIGRTLTGTEEYAVAKMRLFQAFDDVEDLAAKLPGQAPELTVDASDVERFLTQLDV